MKDLSGIIIVLVLVLIYYICGSELVVVIALAIMISTLLAIYRELEKLNKKN